jgi:exosome complex RNA-binding protein Rrp4
MISAKPERIDNTYIEDGKTYSMVTGMYDQAKGRLIQLEGEWLPQKGDLVIGIVANNGRNGMYTLDLSHFMNGLLIEKKGSANFAKGDIVEAEVDKVENRKTVVLSMPKILRGGTVMEIKPSKVHRVIGKNNTMIKQISESTKTTIVPGENGIIWLHGENVALAASAIAQVEREAHVSGLTEIIRQMLISKAK